MESPRAYEFPLPSSFHFATKSSDNVVMFMDVCVCENLYVCVDVCVCISSVCHICVHSRNLHTQKGHVRAALGMTVRQLCYRTFTVLFDPAAAPAFSSVFMLVSLM